MNIETLLKSENVSLPIVKSNCYFPDFIKNLFEGYIKLIGELEDEGLTESSFVIKEIVENLCKNLLEAINRYYSGFPIEAYEQIKRAMANARSYLIYNKNVSSDLVNMFRVRIGNNHTYKKEEMFHIPFEHRAKVATQRYSIPGLPSLYLGSSVYICWEEIGRPDVNSLQVCRIGAKVNTNLKILDFGYRPLHIYDIYKNFSIDFFEEIGMSKEELVTRYIITWPILACCSIRVNNRTDVFKSEYIIPQLILQWVSLNKNVDGIKYFSVNPDYKPKSNEGYQHYSLYQNFVYPVKSTKKEGLCDVLTSQFTISETLSWQVAKLQDLKSFLWQSQESQTIDKYTNMYKKIELIKGVPVEYRRTDFFYIEDKLRQMDLNNIE